MLTLYSEPPRMSGNLYRKCFVGLPPLASEAEKDEGGGVRWRRKGKKCFAVLFIIMSINRISFKAAEISAWCLMIPSKSQQPPCLF